MSQVPDILQEMKLSKKIDDTLCRYIRRIATYLDETLQMHDDRLIFLENKQKENKLQFKTINKSLNEMKTTISEDFDIELDFSYYDKAIKKVDNIQQIVEAISPYDEIFHTYGNKESYSEMKEAIFSNTKTSVNTPLGDVFRKSICSDDLSSVKYLFPILDIDQKYSDGNTALHIAIENNFDKIVRFLIEKGASFDINEIRSARSSKVRKMLRSEVDKRKPAVFHDTVLESIENDDLESIKFLFMFRDVTKEDKNEYGETPLHIACEKGKLNIVKYLIDKQGSNIEEKSNYGDTPLKNACTEGHLDVVKYLIEEKGASIMSVDNDGCTPLHNACSSDNFDVVKYLVKKGAKIEALNQWNQTPLHTASSNGYLDIVKYLTEMGANIEAKSSHGKTPLQYACEWDQLDVIKYLVEEKGANIKLDDSEGRTPFWESCSDEVKKYMESKMSK